jgi:DNA-directed RNA polymerase specialized sigma24 family protein
MIPGSDDYYTAFRDGDERALTWTYTRYYRALCNHGRQIIDDEFTVSCIVQEAFLKGWQFRERMENMRHIYCFIQQDVSWKCYAYLANPANRFHRSLVHTDALENYSSCYHDQHLEDASFCEERKIKAIEEAQPYLPANGHTIMTLYFKHGMSYKKIARRFGAFVPAISTEVCKSLESLKKVVHAQKKLELKPKGADDNGEAYTKNSDTEMQQIFKLRYEHKLSFAAIAEKLAITQGEVQRQYVGAHRRMRELEPSKKRYEH